MRLSPAKCRQNFYSSNWTNMYLNVSEKYFWIYSARKFKKFVFSKIRGIVLTRIPLHGVLQNFPCNILKRWHRHILCGCSLLRDAVVMIFSRDFGGKSFVLNWMKSHKDIYPRFILLAITVILFRCMQLNNSERYCCTNTTSITITSSNTISIVYCYYCSKIILF